MTSRGKSRCNGEGQSAPFFKVDLAGVARLSTMAPMRASERCASTGKSACWDLNSATGNWGNSACRNPSLSSPANPGLRDAGSRHLSASWVR